jgi:aspartate-semialdehyde dehydrogenase
MPTPTSSYRLRRSPPSIAIVGATGAVGAELLRILAEREFPVRELRLLASPRSDGKALTFGDHDIGVEALGQDSFAGVDLALFSAGSDVARDYAPIATRAGAIVVDNSSAFRMNPAVPLVVPEINTAALAGHDGIIANPNCAAIIAITPLWPIHQRNRIRRLILSTYPAASGAGAAAMDELVAATRAYLDDDNFTPLVLPHPYAFNLFSHDTKIDLATGL